MTIKIFFLGPRRSDKRYGPQSKDMQVSEFISLISPKNAPHKVVLPDFTGLAIRLDAQIRNQFHQLKEDEHFLRYRQLSERWYQAGSISDRNNRSKRFEKIMDDSLDFLLYSQDVMPNINPDDLQWHDYEKARGHCCKVSDEAAFCLIQRPYISKTLLTRRISPRGSP
ncbi:hypothetical protein [Escherichia coli]|uniref:hypothetical protein n=1 Tax=Escherichia coli TaxID=562 RepID=UPI000DEDE3E1|nr:hypothetical protein [Escherichia coli]